MPALSPLAQTLAVVAGGQALAALVFVPLQTEKFYDLCGSLGFLSATAASLIATPSAAQAAVRLRGGAGTGAGVGGLVVSAAERIKAVFSGCGRGTLGTMGASAAATAGARRTELIFARHPRQLLASAFVVVWAARLGSFLFARIHKSGRDPRFDSIKQRPLAFLGAWFLQAMWVGITALPVYMLNALPAASHAPLGIFDAAAISVWVAGMALEVSADRTKAQWRQERQDGQHKEKFLERGVWAWCRHPNYFGEITLWTGQALLALPMLASPAAGRAFLGGWAPFAALASPVLEYALIRYISGVPMLEDAMDKKGKGDRAYKTYKRRVPCFVPFIGSSD